MEPTRVKLRTSTSAAISAIGVVAVALLLLVWLAFARGSQDSSDSGQPPQMMVPAAGAAAPTAVGVAPTAGAIQQVRDPQAEIALRVIATGGSTCFTHRVAFQATPSGKELDAQIDGVGGDHRWLTRDQSWIGDAEEAVAAFGAKWAGQRPDSSGEVWIQVTRGGKDIGLQLRETKTPMGRTVWRAGNTATQLPTCEGNT